MQIRYLNRALQRFDSTQVIPTQFVLFTLSVIIGSAVLYRDFESTTADRAGKFVGGCLLTFIGVYFITSGRSRNDSESDVDESDEEEGLIGMVDEEAYQDDVDHSTSGEGGPKRRPSVAVSTDSNFDHSRRSSAISDQDGEDGTLTPRRYISATSSRPSIIMTPSRESLPHINDEDNLDTNPWASSSSSIQPSRPPTRPNTDTNTAPAVPNMASSEANDPSTPRPARSERPKVPARNSTPADRPATLSRGSIARMTPGPLITPLSSSLSAVVADSLRRGSVSARRLRHKSSGLKKTRSQTQYRDDDDENENLPTPSPSPAKRAMASDSGVDRIGMMREEEEGGGDTRTRSRSLSETFGALLRRDKDARKGQKRVDEENQGGG